MSEWLAGFIQGFILALITARGFYTAWRAQQGGQR